MSPATPKPKLPTHRKRPSREPAATTPARAASRRADALLFAAIVLLALALRLVYLWQLSGSPMFDQPQLDELYHDQWAQAIAAGKAYVEGPYFRAPLYPAFLATIHKLFGHGYFAPRLVQCVLGSLSCGLLFLIGRRVFGRAVGAVAGFVAATYWMLVYHDNELLIAAPAVFLDLLLIALLLWAARAGRAWAFGLTGIVLGLSAIARPDILPFAPAIVVWLIVLYRRQPRRIITCIASLTAGCLLPIVPVTIRNYVVGHDTVLIASQGGVNFFIGNNAQSNGWSAIVPGTPSGWWEGYHASIARAAEEAHGRPLKPSEVSGYYYGQAWKFIRTQPAQFLALLAHKFSLYWSHWEISNDKNIYFWTERFTPLVRWLPIGFGVLGPLGLLGLVLCWRRRAESFPLWGFILVYMATIVAFFCNARFRVPILAPLILLAVNAAFVAIRTIRQRQWRPAVLGLTVLVLAGVFVNVTPGDREFRYDPQDYLRLGNAYSAHDQLDLAADAYRRAVELNPEFLTPRFKLGSLLARTGRVAEGIAELRRALQIQPRTQANETDETLAAVHGNLAGALVQTGATAEAIEHYQAALRLDPRGQQREAQFNLGLLYGDTGRTAEAIAALQKVVTADPNDRPAQLWLARRLIDAQRPDESVAHYREILRVHPNDADALYELSGMLFANGDQAQAVAMLRRYAQAHGDDPNVVDRATSTLLRVGRYAEARDVLRDALRLNNRWLTNRLAFLLATCPEDTVRDGAAALRYAQQLCPNPDACDPPYLDTLAAALAETGDYPEAAARARQVLDRARNSPRPEDRALVDAVAKRLALYESGRPYRLPRP